MSIPAADPRASDGVWPLLLPSFLGHFIWCFASTVSHSHGSFGVFPSVVSFVVRIRLSSSPLSWKLWDAQDPEVRWLRLGLSSSTIKIASSWGTLKDLSEKVSFLPLFLYPFVTPESRIILVHNLHSLVFRCFLIVLFLTLFFSFSEFVFLICCDSRVNMLLYSLCGLVYESSSSSS